MARRRLRENLVVGSQRFLVIGVPADGRTEGELTAAERDIAARAAEGQSNRAIGDARGTSARTVANQLQAIFRKLGVTSRAELVLSRVASGRPAR